MTVTDDTTTDTTCHCGPDGCGQECPAALDATVTFDTFDTAWEHAKERNAADPTYKHEPDFVVDEETGAKHWRIVRREIVVAPTKVTADMTVLRAAALIASKDENRMALASIAIMGDFVVATDSYRLTIMHKDGNGWFAEPMLDAFHKLDKVLIDGAILVSAKLIDQVAKAGTKTGMVAIGYDAKTEDVTVVAGNGLRMVERKVQSEFPRVHSLIPFKLDLVHKVGEQPAFNPDYLADMAKVSKMLTTGRRYHKGDAPMSVRVLNMHLLKPALWFIGGAPDTPSALYLLMPVKVPS